MFQSTTAENFESWEKFLSCYYEPIRSALRLIPYVGEERADDFAQSFFLKMYERDILKQRPAITGRFRNWLYIAARRHAVDEWRKCRRRVERAGVLDDCEAADSPQPGGANAPPDADELYALSVLHMTVERVRRHLIAEGKTEHWTIFEELVLAPLLPGRIAKTRDELLARFPGEGPDFLDNRVTTVKRVFRRILPALVPADPTDRLTPEQRFHELLDILHESKSSRLWLAFLTDPMPGPGVSTASSIDLAARSSEGYRFDAKLSQDVFDDELRVLLAFWLDMPLQEFLEDLESAGPAVAATIRESYARAVRKSSRAAPPLNLERLTTGIGPEIPAAELKVVLERLKSFAKRVHSSLRKAGPGRAALDPPRRESSMPPEIAQVLYDLAGSLALCRCGTRIIGLSDDRFRKNIAWALAQPWLDAKLRPTFAAALKQLDAKCDR
jgi:DNA-directed RNA polymerase specialized sigma24 family protein